MSHPMSDQELLLRVKKRLTRSMYGILAMLVVIFGASIYASITQRADDTAMALVSLLAIAMVSLLFVLSWLIEAVFPGTRTVAEMEERLSKPLRQRFREARARRAELKRRREDSR